MATESESSAVQRAGDPLIMGLLARLAPTGRCDFLPDLPGKLLLAVVSGYHRHPTRVGLTDFTAARARIPLEGRYTTPGAAPAKPSLFPEENTPGYSTSTAHRGARPHPAPETPAAHE